MREEFGTSISKLIFTDDGIRNIKADGSQTEIKYWEILTIKLGFMGLEVSGANGVKIFQPSATKDEKKRMKEMVAFAELQKMLGAPSEYRIKCNVCGHVYCYTSQDVARNEQNKKMSKMHTLSSTVSAFAGTTYNMYEQQKQADALDAQIVDYSKCPKCNSTDITALSEEEWKNLSSKPAERATEAVSAADELKKFKELLDMGVVSQEEFDVKKKQLLGL